MNYKQLSAKIRPTACSFVINIDEGTFNNKKKKIRKRIRIRTRIRIRMQSAREHYFIDTKASIKMFTNTAYHCSGSSHPIRKQDIRNAPPDIV